MNPIIPLDYPDPDVIRVGTKYYMVSTTMYFMPGCEILESDDLINWSHASYVYDVLERTEKQCLTGDQNAYGKGMWAATIRYHKGLFYICFVANDTGKTYLYTSDSISGPWSVKNIEGFYHDCSLLFDDDDKVYIAYGNARIYLTELNEDLSAPKEGGFHKCIVEEKGEYCLGYEGSHLYKINGIYYIFFIHAPSKDHFFRTQACFMTKSLMEDFKGGDCFAQHINYRGSGIAQGGIVDTPSGEWYGILFQDRGAAGRFPMLVPVTFDGDQPVFGTKGNFSADWKPDFVSRDYPVTTVEQLVYSDDFSNTWKTTHDRKNYGSFGMRSAWQFNHIPEENGFECIEEKGIFRINHQTIADDILNARNTLTQRMLFPTCKASVVLRTEGLKNGDVAGICALQSMYGFVGVKKDNDKLSLIMQHRIRKENEFVTEILEEIPFEGSSIRLFCEADFEGPDVVRFFYEKEGKEIQIGKDHQVFFTLDHFTGCRFGLFSYATKNTGGFTEFQDFIYQK